MANDIESYNIDNVEKTPELSQISSNENSNKSVEQIELAEKLVKSFEEKGIKAEVLRLDTDPFSVAIIFPKERKKEEKIVRIYRGVTKVDENMLEIVPYSARKGTSMVEKPKTFEEHKRKSVIFEDLIEVSDSLAHEPTYENFIKYVKKAAPIFGPENDFLLETNAIDLEKCIFLGNPFRRYLFRIQYDMALGPQYAVTPTTPATYNTSQALHYARSNHSDGAVFILDMPVTEFADIIEDTTGETHLKGTVKKDYISGIILCPYTSKAEEEKEKEELFSQFEKATKKIEEKLNIPLMSEEGAIVERRKETQKWKEWDNVQKPKDLATVKKERASEIPANIKLLAKFPEVRLDIKQLEEEAKTRGISVYDLSRKKIYEFHQKRLIATGRESEEEANEKISNFFNSITEDRVHEEKNYSLVRENRLKILNALESLREYADWAEQKYKVEKTYEPKEE